MLERLSCKSHCELWNSIDKDCEAYGENHPRPRDCPIYQKKHPISGWLKYADYLERKEKMKNKRTVKNDT